MGTVMMSTLMFLPLFMQAARGATPTEAGTTVAPMLLGWPLASTVSGRLLPRVGPRSLGAWASRSCSWAPPRCGSSVGGHASANALRVAMFAFGTGMGLANTALLIAVQESVGQAQRGIAMATSMFSRSIGGAVSVGALGALLAHRLAGVVDEAQLNAMLGPERGRSLDAHAVAVMAGAVERAMLPIFVVIAAVGALAAACGMAFPDVSLAPGGDAAPCGGVNSAASRVYARAMGEAQVCDGEEVRTLPGAAGDPVAHGAAAHRGVGGARVGGAPRAGAPRGERRGDLRGRGRVVALQERLAHKHLLHLAPDPSRPLVGDPPSRGATARTTATRATSTTPCSRWR